MCVRVRVRVCEREMLGICERERSEQSEKSERREKRGYDRIDTKMEEKTMEAL